MAFRIDVWNRITPTDPALRDAARQIGVTGVQGIQPKRLFFIQGDDALNFAAAERLTRHLLADPVTEDYSVTRVGELKPPPDGLHHIDVTLQPGVTDPAAESLLWAGHLLGIAGLSGAATGSSYTLSGDLTDDDLHTLAEKLLANTVIHRYAVGQPITPPFVEPQPPDSTVEVIPIRGLSAESLRALSETRRLALNVDEMRAIRDYYRDEERDPTDAELETLAQTWSEHCVHKTFKARITYTGPEHGPDAHTPPTVQEVGSLLGDYIRAATDEVDRDWVQSAFVDNAGIVAFDDAHDLAFKVETHNHPSALEPFGGANTGVGGVVRDVLGVSARPIANTDVLCFGPADMLPTDLPEGVLHPRRVRAGVIAGIEDYGNKMGIPTVNGAILYHPGYTANPLVYVGCLGVLPHGSHPTDPQPGDLIVVLGGRTGRDGLRGATFSSMEMDETTAEIAGTAVQIGHPINEKQIQEVVLQARDEKLYNAITDCGAGGLSSAVGEMGEHIGAAVRLEDVPLKYPGLRPWEIWLSEAQERMVLAVPVDKWPRLQEIAAAHDIEAVQIGAFAPTGRLQLTYEGATVGDLSMDFLHNGLPPRHMVAEWQPPQPAPIGFDEEPNLTPALLSLLAHPTIASKEGVIRVYDHEVQGGTALKPLTGAADAGPSDAAALVPQEGLTEEGAQPGAVIANGINPLYGAHDPYAMAWAAVDEALRNAVAAGANPDRIAILDNFCWGNPNLPDRLGALVRCAQGCYDAAVAYRVPFISGKDSLNNEYADPDGTRHAIPGTLLVSALGIVPDVRQTVSSDLKAVGNLLFIVGETRDELGGSHYALLHGDEGGSVPQPTPGALDVFNGLYAAIRAGVVQAAHDLSEGGLAVALAEMCIGGRLGAEVDLVTAPGAEAIARSDSLLFSESLTRFVVEVEAAKVETFLSALGDVPVAHIGRVTADGLLTVRAWGEEPSVVAPVVDLEAAWRGLPANAITVEAPPPAPNPVEVPAVVGSRPPVAILHARGTNRDRDALPAIRMAGGEPEIVLVNHLLDGSKALNDYGMLVVPGGFSFGDDLGAGVIWATALQHALGEQIAAFVDDGRPTLGICNGFQVLVKAGILQGPSDGDGTRSLTLTYNERGHFECRWVWLQPEGDNLFTAGLEGLIHCPVAHGEGRIAFRDAAAQDAFEAAGLVALRYVDAYGNTGGYPVNPNGSAGAIAGVSNAAGNVLGLMPHPEDHIFGWQHPRHHRGERGQRGLMLFANGVRAAK